jgi:hypothetical protein
MAVGLMAAKKKKASGTNIEDWQRGTERITLRLKPEVMQLLYSLSSEIGEAGKPETYAETIRQALEALNREMNEETAENEGEGT